MKIIKKGKLPESKTKDYVYWGTCYNCGCTVETLREEIKIKIRGDRKVKYVYCPTSGCSHNITLRYKNMKLL